uniref:Uncharacterized protein n=1 Tax=Oryzias melastigma TaxID=30732 RepID=A0A3B3CID8_ORYME
MEVKQLKREVKALISDYIGQKLREKSFDPAGRGVSSVLDDLAHYDLALSVAFWWLNRMDERWRPAYPDRSEREAMILSSFAGIIMPQGAIVYPLTLSHHPFAMLASYKAQSAEGACMSFTSRAKNNLHFHESHDIIFNPLTPEVSSVMPKHKIFNKL